MLLIYGVATNSSKSWFYIGPFGIQPSEFVKIIIILFFAKLIDKKQKEINKFSTLILLAILLIIPVLLIMKQPDLSTSLVFVFIFLMLLYVGGISYKYIISAVLIGIPIIFLILIYIQNPNQKLLKDYQRDRIMAMIHKDNKEYADDYFQTKQSVHAIGSGQLYGKGLYKGTLNQLSYLPEPHTDFIFSVIGEEFGFVGCILILGLFLLLITRALWIAKDAKDLFGKLLVVGVVSMLGFQAFVNIGVVTALLPNTGLPLPFISAGGSSLWTNMIGIGLILNVGMRRKKSFGSVN
jgi:rod shape determining protein RodA